MRVCIVGGGHIGTTLLCYIKHTHPEYWVSLYTRRPDSFAGSIKCNDIEGSFSYYVTPDCISNDAAIAADGANIVFIALPHFAVENAFRDIAQYVASDAFIGVLPGGGGCEFFFNHYFDDKKTLFGFQRVPFTAKLQQYGKETNLKSWKPFSVVGTLQRSKVDTACEMIEACGLQTKKATNYLEVALTPTNPILHTSRTFEIFGNFNKEHVFWEKLKFYVGWTDNASRTLFAMDGELHQLLDKLQASGIETSAIRPLSEHYESPNVETLTRKINSIATFQSVYAPMIEQDGGFVADMNSRMFTEDFPWGLLIIRSYFSFFDIDAPKMDELLQWYASYTGKEWYVNGKLSGKDLDCTGIISKYEIRTAQELISLYLQ